MPVIKPDPLNVAGTLSDAGEAVGNAWSDLDKGLANLFIQQGQHPAKPMTPPDPMAALRALAAVYAQQFVAPTQAPMQALSRRGQEALDVLKKDMTTPANAPGRSAKPLDIPLRAAKTAGDVVGAAFEPVAAGGEAMVGAPVEAATGGAVPKALVGDIMAMGELPELAALRAQRAAKAGGKAAEGVRAAEAAGRAPDAAMSAPRMTEGYNPEAVKLGETDRIEAANARHHLDAPALKSMEADFRKELDRLGLHDVDVQGLTHAQMTNLTGDASAGGFFDTNFSRPLIRVAMHDVGSPRSIFNHETAHALEHVGVVKPGEKEAVLAFAQKDPELAAWVKANYDPKNPENIKSELFAESYSRWVEGRSNPTPPVKAIFQRVKNFFEAMGNTFKGRGFRSADDVFKSMHEGRMGARERGASTLGEGGAGGNEIFIGKKGAEQVARTPETERHPEFQNMAPVSMAERMERDGVEPEAIRQRTGWWRDPNDGNWKYEIDDSKMGMRSASERFDKSYNDARAGKPNTYGTAAHLFDHPALFQAYPELAKFKAFDRAHTGTLGSFDPKNESIRFEPDQWKLNTAAHELQHGVQHFEGWPRGGNPEMVAKYLGPERLAQYKTDRIAEAQNLVDAAAERVEVAREVFNAPSMREYFTAIANGERPASSDYRAVFGFVDRHPKRVQMNEAMREVQILLGRKPGMSADQAMSDVLKDYQNKTLGPSVALSKVKGSSAEDLALYADRTSREKWYNQLAGEYEARDAGARQTMTPEERKELPPRSGEFIHPKNLIYRCLLYTSPSPRD